MNDTSREAMKIRIPIIGLENAGKSTVTNALLQGEYSESRYDACTKIPFHFTLYEPKSGQNIQQPSEVRIATTKTNSAEHTEAAKAEFSIELRDPLWTERLLDAAFGIIDLPGITNLTKIQKCSSTQFIENKWDSFAGALAVLDIELTKETDKKQTIALLKFLNSLNGDVPILVVGNKLDNLGDESQQEKGKSIFFTLVKKWLPNATVIATSAKKPLYYRCASGISFERFMQDFDRRQLDAIGKLIFSDLWNIQDEKRYVSLYEALQKPIPGTGANFEEEVIFCFKELIGTKEKQRKILDRVLTTELGKIEISEWAEAIHLKWIDDAIVIFCDIQRIAGDTAKAMKQFFALVSTFVDLAFEEFKGDVAILSPLNQVFDLLFSKVESANWSDSEGEKIEKIGTIRKEVAVKFVNLLLSKHRYFLERSETTSLVRAPPVSSNGVVDAQVNKKTENRSQEEKKKH